MSSSLETFYLGTHQPHWLAESDVPWFVSHVRLMDRRSFPRAKGRWALDSGGFSLLGKYGAWPISAADYAASVKRYQSEIGGLDWAAPQDWICAPPVLARTRLSVAEHQARTVASYQELCELAPDVPWAPVLQGWEIADFLRCVERYDQAGIDLATAPVVGVGSLAPRQHLPIVGEILHVLAGLELRLHGFGVKTQGLAQASDAIISADSMAWSVDARYLGRPAFKNCTHKNCANCLRYALAWRKRLLQIDTEEELAA